MIHSKKLSFIFASLLVASLGSVANAAPLSTCEGLFVPALHLNKVQAESQGPAGRRTGADWDLVTSAFVGRPFDLALREVFDKGTPDQLVSFLRPMLKSADFRAAIDRWLEKEFVRQSDEIAASKLDRVRDVIVGAGPHTLTLLLNQRAESRATTIVVERASVGSTFHGKHFQLNSAQRGDLNRIPGALFQLSDMTNEGAPPAADDFGFLIRLNYRAAGIRVLQGYQYDGMQLHRKFLRAPSVEVALTNVKNGRKLSVTTKRLGLASGMDVRSQKHFEYVGPGVEIGCDLSERGANMAETKGLATGAGFLQQVHRALRGDRREVFSGPRVAVVGSKHEGLTAVEGVLALIDEGLLPANTQVTVFGLKSDNAVDFANEVTPKGGSDQFKAMIQRRYVDGGVAAAIARGVVVHAPTHVTEISLNQNKFPITVKTEQGQFEHFNMLIQTTGFDRSGGAWGTTRAALLNQAKVSAVDLKWPGATDPIGYGLYSQQVRGSSLVVYSFGVGASLPVSPDRLKGAIGNPDALYVTLPYTELLGRWLDRRP